MDVLGGSLEALRSREEELRPAYEEYSRVRHAIVSLERIQGTEIKEPSGNGRGRPPESAGFYLPNLICDAMKAMDADHHTVGEVFDKLRETYSGSSRDSIAQTMQTMAKTGKLVRRYRGRYALPGS